MIFLRKFLKHGTRVASVAPSSPSMARELCRFVDPQKPQRILELGAGTGAVTREIVRRMHPQSRLVAVEIDNDFALQLHQYVNGRNAHVLVADVSKLDDDLRRLGIEQFDLVISGLPMPSLPKRTVLSVKRLVEDRACDARFSQLTEFPMPVYKRFYERLFDCVVYRRVPVNIPPGGVYHCSLAAR
jgi:phospholipid N-methyltransferase